MRDGGGNGGGGDGVSAVNGGRKKRHQRSRQGSDDVKGEEMRKTDKGGGKEWKRGERKKG